MGQATEQTWETFPTSITKSTGNLTVGLLLAIKPLSSARFTDACLAQLFWEIPTGSE